MNRLFNSVAASLCVWLVSFSQLTAADVNTPVPATESPEATAIHQAIDASYERVQSIAINDPGALGDIFQQAFGERLSTAARAQFVAEASQGTLPLPDGVVLCGRRCSR